MSRRATVSAGLAAIALLWALSGAAVAKDRDTDIFIHAGDTEVEPVVGGVITVCAFHLLAVPRGTDPDGHETGFWRITNLATGAVALEGQYEVTDPDPQRIPDSGLFALPEGMYNLWWDDEPFAPGSHLEKDFAVDCPSGQPTPSPTPSPAPTRSAAPTPSGSATPTQSAAPTPSGSAAPTPSGSAAPTPSGTAPGGSVLPTTGNSIGGGGGVTLPPTDQEAAVASQAPAESSAWPFAIALAIVAGIAFLLTPRRAPSPTRVKRPR
jgi:hypothetical protein